MDEDLNPARDFADVGEVHRTLRVIERTPTPASSVSAQVFLLKSSSATLARLFPPRLSTRLAPAERILIILVAISAVRVAPFRVLVYGRVGARMRLILTLIALSVLAADLGIRVVHLAVFSVDVVPVTLTLPIRRPLEVIHTVGVETVVTFVGVMRCSRLLCPMLTL